jgi:hypothetical protein
MHRVESCNVSFRHATIGWFCWRVASIPIQSEIYPPRLCNYQLEFIRGQFKSLSTALHELLQLRHVDWADCFGLDKIRAEYYLDRIRSDPILTVLSLQEQLTDFLSSSRRVSFRICISKHILGAWLVIFRIAPIAVARIASSLAISGDASSFVMAKLQTDYTSTSTIRGSNTSIKNQKSPGHFGGKRARHTQPTACRQRKHPSSLSLSSTRMFLIFSARFSLLAHLWSWIISVPEKGRVSSPTVGEPSSCCFTIFSCSHCGDFWFSSTEKNSLLALTTLRYCETPLDLLNTVYLINVYNNI